MRYLFPVANTLYAHYRRHVLSGWNIYDRDGDELAEFWEVFIGTFYMHIVNCTNVLLDKNTSRQMIHLLAHLLSGMHQYTGQRDMQIRPRRIRLAHYGCFPGSCRHPIILMAPVLSLLHA